MAARARTCCRLGRCNWGREKRVAGRPGEVRLRFFLLVCDFPSSALFFNTGRFALNCKERGYNRPAGVTDLFNPAPPVAKLSPVLLFFCLLPHWCGPGCDLVT